MAKKYINANKLKAEIERLQCEQSYKNGIEEMGYQFAIMDILDIIDSLQQEQSEVHLEKEIDDYLSCSEDIEECADNEHYYVTKSALLDIIHYFVNLN